jgi:glutamine synthetase type III
MPRENLRFLFFCAALLRAVEASPADISLNPDLEAVMAALARGEDSRGLPVEGKGFEVHGALGETALEDAIDDLTLDIEAWTAAGDDLRSAVREVIAGAYRRHRALVLS